ncbi:MAG: type VI secretion system-associated FHA domain protein TagH [Paracoccaceae bacterium]
MTLTLRIENYQSLEGGSPIEVSSTGRSLRIGRANGMDWVLPDPTRFISSHHFDMDFHEGAWWLTDKSTNGTFLVGQPYRLDGPYRVNSGDRFQVGQYFVIVRIGAAAQAVAQGYGQPAPYGGYAPPPAAHNDDPWAVGTPVAAPIDPMPRADGRRMADFSDDFIVTPVPQGQPTPFPPQYMPAAPIPPAVGPSGTPFGSQPQSLVGGAGLTGPASAPPLPLATPPAFGAPPPPPPSIGFAPPPHAVAPLASDAPLAATPQSLPMPAPAAPAAAPTPADKAAPQAFLRAFCEGAGLPTDKLGNLLPETFAHELGRTMRIVATELMALLQDRATTKRFTKGGDRTMIGATNNNPLKFLPDSAQALEVMFLTPREGFLKGGDGVASGLADVRLHQMAVFAAIQPALIKLLADLAPEAIDDGSGGGLLGGGANKKKAWDTYVERWDAKAGKHENGMLDVFLANFAESYSAAVAAARKDGGPGSVD